MRGRAMIGSRFISGALVGGVGAAVVMATGAAFAGSGVGGVFNLGRSNSVNATTTLTGSVGGPQLSVRNGSGSSSAAGERITVEAGKPPIVVTGSHAVSPHLNADQVDGRHADALNRAASTQGYNFFPFIDSSSTIATLTLDVPKDGFVVLSGNSTAAASVGCDCNAIVWFHDSVTNTDTAPQLTNIRSDRVGEPSITVTVPATAGTHTYTLQGGYYDLSNTGGTADFYNVGATAQLVPFNATGGTSASRSALTPHARSGIVRHTPSGVIRR